MRTVVSDVKVVKADAGQRSAEMHNMLTDVEHRMVQRESSIVIEIQARMLQQQEEMQAQQAQLQMIIQVQVSPK